MSQASAYPVIKQALVARLQARAALANVNVLDHVPVNVDEIRTPTGAMETIFPVGADGTSLDVVFCAGALRFDEEFILDLVVEVHGTDSDSTQPVVDARVNELLYEVLADIADQQNWDKATLGLDVFEYVYFTPSTYLWGETRIQQTEVYAANVTLGLGVNARRSFNS
jgi:hypothetical protein